MLVPITQVILQTAPLLTEVHAMYVPENLLRNPSLFRLYPPFEMKQEMGIKSFHFLQCSCLLSPWCGWPCPCCSWAHSFAPCSSWDFWPLEENSNSTTSRFSVQKYFFHKGHRSVLLSSFPRPPAKASITFSCHPASHLTLCFALGKLSNWFAVALCLCLLSYLKQHRSQGQTHSKTWGRRWDLEWFHLFAFVLYVSLQPSCFWWRPWKGLENVHRNEGITWDPGYHILFVIPT